MAVTQISINYNRKNDQIQSLRGIAVLAVISYHLFGFPNSGFLGVTSFFVISGYVVTSILLNQEFSLKNLRGFYRKRFLKLYPAMVVCLLFTCFSSMVFLSPLGDSQSTFRVAVGSLFGIANFILHYINLDYFGPNIEFNPLSHFWSLSVEFQYYFLFSPIVWLFVFKKKLPLLIKIISLGIFFGLLLLLFHDTISAKLSIGNSLIGYYGLLTNSLPLLMGALLAILQFMGWVLSPNRSNFILGFSLLIFSYLIPNTGNQNRILGILCNITGTFTLIALSLNRNKEVFLNPLNIRVLKNVGDFSYSLYLYHWPLICFTNIAFPSKIWIKILSLLITFPLAFFSYKIFELKIKNRLQNTFLSQTFLISIILVPIFFIFIFFRLTNGEIREKYLSNPIYKNSISNSQFQSKIQNSSSPCSDIFLLFITGKIENECRVKEPRLPIDIFVLGDSHAQQLYPGFVHQYQNQNIGFLMKANGELNWNSSSDRDLWRYLVEDLKPRLLILNFRWEIRNISNFSNFMTNQKSYDGNSSVNILLLSGNPSFPFEASVCKYGLLILASSRCTVVSESLLLRMRPKIQELKQLADQEHMVFLDTFPHYCRGDFCSMVYGKRILYRDNNHLSVAGALDYVSNVSRYITSLNLLTPQ